MLKCDFNEATLLKSHFGMGVLLQICSTFSEHLLLRAPLNGCFCCLLLSLNLCCINSKISKNNKNNLKFYVSRKKWNNQNKCSIAWKVSKYDVFFWSVFSCIWTECGPEKIPFLDTFHAVQVGNKKLLRCKVSHKTFDFNLQTTSNSKITFFFLFILLVLTKAAQYLLTYKSSH